MSTAVNTTTYTPGRRLQVVLSKATGKTISSITIVAQHETNTVLRVTQNTLNYRGKVRKKEPLPHNPFRYNKRTFQATRGSFRSVSANGDITHNSGSFASTAFATDCDANNGYSTAEYNRMEDKHITALLLKVKQEKVNVLNMLAERKQTIDLFISTAKSMTDIIINLKKGDYVAAAKAAGLKVGRASRTQGRLNRSTEQAKAIANAWIQLQYGWKPLVEDCRTAVLALTDPDLLYTIVKKSTRGSFNFVKKSSADPTRLQTDVASSEITISSSLMFSVTMPSLHDAAEWGLTNPFSPLWELTPWSFIVDWFLPVGNALAAIDATVGLTFNDGSTTVFRKTDKIRHTQAVFHLQDKTTGSAVTMVKELDCTRVRLLSFPAVPLPSFKDPTGWLHAANALSLAVQRVR